MSVVIEHTTPLFGVKLLPAYTAVWAFFVISGFYMQLVIVGKYTDALTFYSNRLLRLYPAYFVALVLALCVQGLPDLSSLDTLGRFLVAIPNLSIFGSDLLFLVHHGSASGWHFTLGQPIQVEGDQVERAGRFLMNPPAWSLGIELWFYLLVPLLARTRVLTLGLLTGASFALRIWMEARQPWVTYFFFPANFGFFGLGMLAQRAWCSRRFQGLNAPRLTWTVTLGCVALLLAREVLPGFRNYPWMHWAMIAAAMPFIFQATKMSNLDRRVGNLSYPIYILHSPVTNLVLAAGFSATAPLVVSITVVLALVVNTLLEDPIDRWRQRRTASMAGWWFTAFPRSGGNGLASWQASKK